MKDVVIVGHSGFAKEIKWLLEGINQKGAIWNFIGYIDKNKNSPDIIGDDEFLIKYSNPLDVVIAIADGTLRRKLYEKYRNNNNLSFPNLIAPSIRIDDRVSLGIGNIICEGTIITVEVVFGDFNIVNLDCTIGHEAVIGNFVTLNPSVNLSGKALIEDSVNIGTGTQVLQGIRIGYNAVIGAGAVVTNDVEGGSTAVGVPAKVIRKRLNGNEF